MEGEKPEPVVETTDATSVLAKDATETGSIDTVSIKSKLEESREPSADSVPPITSYQIKPMLQDK